MKSEVMLIGAGDMAIEYTKVLDGMNVNYVIIGRGEKSASRCEEITGHQVYRGGIEKYLSEERCAKLDNGQTFAVCSLIFCMISVKNTR